MSMDKCKKACCLFKFFLSISKNSTWLLRQGVLCLHFQNCKWDYFSFEILLCWWGADCRNCEVTLTDFEKKNPPSTHISTLHVYWFLRFFPPSTPRLLQLCTSFFQEIRHSTFILTSSFINPENFAPPSH